MLLNLTELLGLVWLQIRAQFAACGCPIFGDVLYSSVSPDAAAAVLHDQVSCLLLLLHLQPLLSHALLKAVRSGRQHALCLLSHYVITTIACRAVQIIVMHWSRDKLRTQSPC